MAASAVFAQKVKTVEAEYTYRAPENVTLEQARRTALERARIQAIADEFGTIVQQTSATRLENRNGETQTDFLSIGGSEVKGEWIETLGEPQYEIRYEQGMLVVTCRVKGKAREITTAQIDFKALVLRNGVEDRFESDRFKNGDDLYLSFQSPVAGWLAVYLMDDERQAFCLLPYQSQQTGIYQIEANRRYVFFSAKEASAAERSMVDEYTMTCERTSEHNQIYVVFSPNIFVKAADVSTSEGLPRQLGYEAFQQWLAKCRKRDTQMNLRMIPISVNR
ncbi:MAG: DUF4384 domain-containing protein [Bacteroidaceae bacterium]|nr:DUF4384 domain-containing protein [Bacteroidaceae bacterium]